ncbi:MULTISPECIES: 4-(cytidine 5'-diphospho)-2-C-methyl-D-erythritol kinase [unclassified Fibrobacter]|uniref:4-(cytidine 5'-diphospho)-2-C-methyl-D-erythritol kinase n=1 Tax=unclassified Fibrobacter TaxID=2634177 RepID=UPI0025C1AFC3|nr:MULTISPECIES: 4-(cytidine 5'-diphospho)-2-C-methyl-D-erythritol kinase [unclassified Fibrobacter]
MTMKEFAPAKINLFLDVIRKREDGYHDLGTVFQTVDVGDTLEFSARDDGEIHLEYSNPQEYPVESDLVYKAAVALRSHVGNNDLGADIFLDKIMPLGAGLGGGSADAAAALRALNRLWELRLPPAELERIGAKLGADVPFLVRGGTAFAEGIGDRLSFISPLDLPAGEVLLIATPHDAVPTKDAYAGVPKSGPDRWEGYKLAWETASDAERSFGGPLLDSGAFFNAFEISVFPKHPLVAAMKDKFLDLGARVALMSGSGASVFGIFADRQQAEAAAETLRAYSRYIALTKFWHG